MISVGVGVSRNQNTDYFDFDHHIELIFNKKKEIMNTIRNIFSLHFWLYIYVLVRFEWSGAVQITKPLSVHFKNGSGYLQIANHKPPKYFAIVTPSRKYVIVRTIWYLSYNEHGRICYYVSFHLTEFYVDKK